MVSFKHAREECEWSVLNMPVRNVSGQLKNAREECEWSVLNMPVRNVSGQF